MDKAANHAFWQTPSPARYAQASPGRAAFLLELLSDIPGGSVLEIGCNCGRNLVALQLAGYDAYGVEISTKAVAAAPARLKERIFHADAESWLNSHNSEYDVVFSMAALMHFHPDSIYSVATNMARIAKTVITIECELAHAPPHTYARDYGLIFTNQGMRQVYICSAGADLHMYTARVFCKN